MGPQSIGHISWEQRKESGADLIADKSVFAGISNDIGSVTPCLTRLSPDLGRLNSGVDLAVTEIRVGSLEISTGFVKTMTSVELGGGGRRLLYRHYQHQRQRRDRTVKTNYSQVRQATIGQRASTRRKVRDRGSWGMSVLEAQI